MGVKHTSGASERLQWLWEHRDSWLDEYINCNPRAARAEEWELDEFYDSKFPVLAAERKQLESEEGYGEQEAT